MLIDLHTRLRELREEHHLSQKVVSMRIGCSKSIISSYETGDRQPSLGNLIALARLYHVSTDYLLGKTDTMRDLDFTNLIDVNGLTDEQIKAVQLVITCMKASNVNLENNEEAFDTPSEINE